MEPPNQPKATLHQGVVIRKGKKAITHKVLLTTFGVGEGEYMWTFDNVITLEDLMRI